VALVKPKLAWIFLHYLRILARFQLAKINFWRRIRGKKPVVIVGITGSAGKTSTMSATVAALKDSFQVKYSEKANSESGIPLNILGLAMKDYSLRDWWRVAVLFPLANNCRLKKAIAIIRRKFCLPPGEFLAEEKTNFLVISSFSCGKFVFSNSRNYF